MNSCCNNSVIKYTQGNEANFILSYYEDDNMIPISSFDEWRVTLLRDGVVASGANGTPFGSNVIKLHCPATLPVGKYSVETVMRKGTIQRRSFLCGVIEVVECDQDANIGYTNLTFGDNSIIQVKIQYVNLR